MDTENNMMKATVGLTATEKVTQDKLSTIKGEASDSGANLQTGSKYWTVDSWLINSQLKDIVEEIQRSATYVLWG